MTADTNNVFFTLHLLGFQILLTTNIHFPFSLSMSD